MFCHPVDYTSKLVFFSYRLDSEDKTTKFLTNKQGVYEMGGKEAQYDINQCMDQQALPERQIALLPYTRSILDKFHNYHDHFYFNFTKLNNKIYKSYSHLIPDG